MFYPCQNNCIIAEDPASYGTPNIEPVHIWWSSREDIVALRLGHNPSRYRLNLDVARVDFDGELAGYYFLNTFRQSPFGNLTLHWHYKYPIWAIVVLLPNTVRLVDESLSSFTNTATLLTSPFTFTPPILVTYEEGCNSLTSNNYVLPPIQSAIAIANAPYGQILRKEVVENLFSSSNSYSDRSLQLLNTFQLESLLVDSLAAQYQNIHPAPFYVGKLREGGAIYRHFAGAR